MQHATKSTVSRRLKRIEGQVRGIERMVDEGRYCIDVITQLAAVRAALRRVEEAVLEDHVGHCVHDAMAHGSADAKKRKIAELMDVFARASR